MNCAFCKTDIEDDSLYCDQCGLELLVCPKCSKPGKGKVCTADGSLLVTKTKVAADSAPMAGPRHLSGGSELHLVNKTLNLDIKIDKAVLVGRVKGELSDIFGKHSRVSGEHLKIDVSITGLWSVTDLGSRHGTKYNTQPLIPMSPQALADNSYLQIANIEFHVRIIDDERSVPNGTARV